MMNAHSGDCIQCGGSWGDEQEDKRDVMKRLIAGFSVLVSCRCRIASNESAEHLLEFYQGRGRRKDCDATKLNLVVKLVSR